MIPLLSRGVAKGALIPFCSQKLLAFQTGTFTQPPLSERRLWSCRMLSFISRWENVSLNTRQLNVCGADRCYIFDHLHFIGLDTQREFSKNWVILDGFKIRNIVLLNNKLVCDLKSRRASCAQFKLALYHRMQSGNFSWNNVSPVQHFNTSCLSCIPPSLFNPPFSVSLSWQPSVAAWPLVPSARPRRLWLNMWREEGYSL